MHLTHEHAKDIGGPPSAQGMEGGNGCKGDEGIY